MEVIGGEIEFRNGKIDIKGIRGRKDYSPFVGEVEIPIGLRTSFFSFCFKALKAGEDNLDIKPAEYRGNVRVRMFINENPRNGYIAGMLVTDTKQNMSTKFLFRKYHLLEFMVFFAELPKVTTVADLFLLERTKDGNVRINQEPIPEDCVKRVRAALSTDSYYAGTVNDKPIRVGKIFGYGELKAPLDEEGRIRMRSVFGI
ncbi:hypothetical protein [Desulfurobacterium sp. TC5-1]|uniref:hypothetical protein n=1 Tax=Desulfurobacterium sp. TC5-1 TaxID=1158318 RepID=UPI0003B4BA16|nr:hypothetical protein [Desulfurobacterium sp. TC5-1]